MRIPGRITAMWIDSLTNDDLLTAESRLKKVFARIERVEKGRLGGAYDLMRGHADLMSAWDRWTRVNAATRSRGLTPLKVAAPTPRSSVAIPAS